MTCWTWKSFTQRRKGRKESMRVAFASWRALSGCASVSAPSTSHCGRIQSLQGKGPSVTAHDQRNGHTISDATCGTARQSLRACGAAARPRPLDSGSRRAADLSASLAPERHRGRAGAHGHPRAGGHGLRRSLRPARDLRPVCHHRAADRVRHLRAEPHPGAGAGLVAGRHHRRDHRAAGRRRPRSVGRAGRHARPDDRGLVHPRRAGALRLHHGSALQAHPPGLSERHRAHRAHRPVAQNPGLFVERG